MRFWTILTAGQQKLKRGRKFNRKLYFALRLKGLDIDGMLSGMRDVDKPAFIRDVMVTEFESKYGVSVKALVYILISFVLGLLIG